MSAPRLAVRSIDLHEFLSLDLPPRDYLLTPILPQQGLAMIHGPRGLGKTHVSIAIAYAVASGGTFLRWAAPAPKGVLFVDGEMPAVVLQDRFAAVVAASPANDVAPMIKLITPDLNLERGLPDLSQVDGQRAIDAHVDEAIRLIVVDNLSSLVRAGIENEAESWTAMQTWALRHRAAGRSVLFVHHSGKGGAQRGTSRREDVLDTVIALRQPADYDATQGARFEIHFEKARGFYGDAARAFDVRLTTDGRGLQSWTMADVDDSREDRIVDLYEDGMRPNDIAADLGLHRATVYRKLQAAGLLKARSKPKPNGRDWHDRD